MRLYSRLDPSVVRCLWSANTGLRNSWAVCQKAAARGAKTLYSAPVPLDAPFIEPGPALPHLAIAVSKGAP